MFNEPEFIKLIFLLADTQAWLDDMAKDAFGRIPVSDKKKFLKKSYYLPVSVLAHIIERHYYKINRYPNAGKFLIPLAEVLFFIREAHASPVAPAPGNNNNFEREVLANHIIGYDKAGQPTNIITVLTDAAGKIITAFPGKTYISCFHDNLTPRSTPQ